MIILNFGHPLTGAQVAAAERLAGLSISRLIEVEMHLDPTGELAAQVKEAIGRVGLSSTEWQTAQLLVNLPGYPAAAACLLAEIEGRRGHLPTIIHISRQPGQVLTEYRVTALLNLEEVRAQARPERYSK